MMREVFIPVREFPTDYQVPSIDLPSTSYTTSSTTTSTTTTPPAIPQLVYDVPSLRWTWPTEPYIWVIQRSPDGVTGWTSVGNADGFVFTKVETASGFYRVYGVDSLGATLTPFSNSVQVV